MSYPLKKLGDISILINDGNYGGDYPKKEEFISDGIPFLTAKNILERGNIRYDNIMHISRDKHSRLKKAQITTGDILIVNRGAKDGLVNIASIVTDDKFIDANIGPQLTRIRVDLKCIDNKYLYYYFYTTIFKEDFEKVTSGSALKFVNLTKTKNFQIPLPPLPTQKAIVQKLDTAFEKIDASIELAKKNLENVEELGKSVLEEVFGESRYEEKILSEVSEIINGGTPKTGNPDYWDGDICWITPKDMGKMNSRYVSETSRMISKNGLDKSSARIFPVNSVILSSRAPIGHLAINTVPMCTNQGCKTLVPGKQLVTIYLYYFLLNSVKLLNELGSGTTFKELSGTKLKEVKIPLPPLEKQKEIVEHLDRVFEKNKKLKEMYEEKLRSLQEVKQSLLREAFEGRLIKE